MNPKRVSWNLAAKKPGSESQKGYASRHRRNHSKEISESFHQFWRDFQKNLTTALLYRRATDLIAQYSEYLSNDADGDLALRALVDAVDLAPNQVKCHNNLAVFYWQIGELEKAVHHLERARVIDPYDRDTVWNCGQIMKIAGEPLIAKYTYCDYMRHRGYDLEMAEAIVAL